MNSDFFLPCFQQIEMNKREAEKDIFYIWAKIGDPLLDDFKMPEKVLWLI